MGFRQTEAFSDFCSETLLDGFQHRAAIDRSDRLTDCSPPQVGRGAARGRAGGGWLAVGAGPWHGMAVHSQPAGAVDRRPQHFSLPPPGTAGRADTVRLRCRGHARTCNCGRSVRDRNAGGEAAVAVHRGPYNRMNEAHDAIRTWMAANRRDSAGHSWEIYGDPTPDPAGNETRPAPVCLPRIDSCPLTGGIQAGLRVAAQSRVPADVPRRQFRDTNTPAISTHAVGVI